MISATNHWAGGRTRERSGRGAESEDWLKLSSTITHAGIASSLRFLLKNCRKPIRVNNMVDVAGLSRRGFLKSFRKHTGCTPGAVLRDMRIEQAKQLLLECELNMTDVAVASGFRRANSFSIAFKQITGLTPKAYQRRARAQGNRPDWLNGRNGNERAALRSTGQKTGSLKVL